MADIIIFNEGASPQNVTDYKRSVNTPDFSSRSDVLVSPDLSTVSGIVQKFWKVVGSSVVSMTTAEQKTITDAEQAVKDDATALFNSTKTKLTGLGLTDAEADLVLGQNI